MPATKKQPRKASEDDRIVQLAYDAHVAARILGEHKMEPFGNYKQRVATLCVGVLTVRLTNPDRTRPGHYRAVQVKLGDHLILHVSGLHQHWPKQIHCEEIQQFPAVVHQIRALQREAALKEAEAHQAPSSPPEIHIERQPIFVPGSIGEGGLSVRLMRPDGEVQTLHATEIFDLIS